MVIPSAATFCYVGLACEDIKMCKTEDDAIYKAKVDAANCGLIDFDGQNCDDCGGWDGESRRCDCGNRRVYWATTQRDDGTFVAHAEAW